MCLPSRVPKAWNTFHCSWNFQSFFIQGSGTTSSLRSLTSVWPTFTISSVLLYPHLHDVLVECGVPVSCHQVSQGQGQLQSSIYRACLIWVCFFWLTGPILIGGSWSNVCGSIQTKLVKVFSSSTPLSVVEYTYSNLHLGVNQFQTHHLFMGLLFLDIVSL